MHHYFFEYQYNIVQQKVFKMILNTEKKLNVFLGRYNDYSVIKPKLRTAMFSFLLTCNHVPGLNS